MLSGRDGVEKELRKGEVGRGRWALRPLNVWLVGVVGTEVVDDSDVGAGVGRDEGGIGALGVVGVVDSVG